MTTVAAGAAHRTMAFAVRGGLRDQAAGKTIQPAPPQQDEDGEMDSNHSYCRRPVKAHRWRLYQTKVNLAISGSIEEQPREGNPPHMSGI